MKQRPFLGPRGVSICADFKLNFQRCADVKWPPMLIPQQPLITALVALQFVSFGWRLNREISVGDRRSRTWLPLPDYINVFCLFLVVVCCIIAPLTSLKVSRFGNVALAIGYVFIAFHPISEAAHYRLFAKRGRVIYLDKPGGAYPWITDQEIFTVTVSGLVALAICVWVGYHG